MPYPEFHYTVACRLRSSPEELWPIVSDTNRFNFDTGLSSVEELRDTSTLTNARRRLKIEFLRIPIIWEEQPFEWVQPYRFGVRRLFKTGPVGEVRVLAQLQPGASGGTTLTYDVWARPRLAFGLISIPMVIGFTSIRRIRKVFPSYDDLVRQGTGFMTEAVRERLSGNGVRRLQTALRALQDQSFSGELLQRLRDLIATGDDFTLSRIRPYVLADFWEVDRRETLNLFFAATRSGLFELRWDILCPACRNSVQSFATLSDAKPETHCDTCQIDFRANFDAYVELSFRLNPSIRTVRDTVYCVGGPQVTPHIVAQQLLAEGNERTISPLLEPGRYRLRSPGVPGSLPLLVDEQTGARSTAISLSPAGWPPEELPISTHPQLQFRNERGEETLFVLERTAWTDQALTAAEVTSMQMFRDLFSREVLRPNEQISVGTLTVMFTDLCRSTALYHEIGDAPAFGIVMDHLEIMKGLVAKHDGAFVKAMGDGTLSVFRNPLNALRAAEDAHSTLRVRDQENKPLMLKAGLHAGPCIIINQNDRLDYFGSTVNIASRLESLSEGNDIVISSQVYADPEVVDWLPHAPWTLHHTETTLKGFGEKSFPVLRLTKKRDQRSEVRGQK